MSLMFLEEGNKFSICTRYLITSTYMMVWLVILWGSAVYEGYFFAIDVSNPTEPVIFNDSLAFHETPNAFTHNCWISDDGKTLFTTDEKSGAYITAYDVSDLSNIQEIDRIRSSPEIATVIPHNAHVYGDFLVTSYYRDGIVIHDISNPAIW